MLSRSSKGHSSWRKGVTTHIGIISLKALTHFYVQFVESQTANKFHLIILPINFTDSSSTVPPVITLMPSFIPQGFLEDPSRARAAVGYKGQKSTTSWSSRLDVGETHCK